MTYQCDWSLELPVTVGGQVITYCPDVDCVLALDERGDLRKVGFKPRAGNALVWVLSGEIFDLGNEALAGNRSHIMELCGIPSDVRYPPKERPEYSGAEYVPGFNY
jgi:hypothetical protein